MITSPPFVIPAKAGNPANLPSPRTSGIPRFRGDDNNGQGIIMDQATYDKGLEIRRATLGNDYVDKALARTDAFTSRCRISSPNIAGARCGGRDGISRRDRSMINLAMISILNRHNELKVHVKGALTNGLTKEEISEVLLQVAIYAGVPAAVDSFRIANEAFARAGRAEIAPSPPPSRERGWGEGLLLRGRVQEEKE